MVQFEIYSLKRVTFAFINLIIERTLETSGYCNWSFRPCPGTRILFAYLTFLFFTIIYLFKIFNTTNN